MSKNPTKEKEVANPRGRGQVGPPKYPEPGDPASPFPRRGF